MYIVAIAWIFVVVLWAAAEATAPQGSLLGAFFTLLLYGALPLAVVLYVMGTPMRRRARWLAERGAAGAEVQTADGTADKRAHAEAEADGDDAVALADASAPADPDRRGVPAGDAVAPVRKEA